MAVPFSNVLHHLIVKEISPKVPKVSFKIEDFIDFCWKNEKDFEQDGYIPFFLVWVKKNVKLFKLYLRALGQLLLDLENGVVNCDDIFGIMDEHTYFRLLQSITGERIGRSIIRYHNLNFEPFVHIPELDHINEIVEDETELVEYAMENACSEIRGCLKHPRMFDENEFEEYLKRLTIDPLNLSMSNGSCHGVPSTPTNSDKEENSDG